MIIKSIKKMNSGGKYQIIFDDGSKLITYDEVILKNNLLYKKELTTNQINEIGKYNNYYSVYFSVTKFISKKMRSKKEVLAYLDKFELESNEKDRIISELKIQGLLNEYMFIKAYISDRFNLSNEGPLKIKNDLLMHSLNEQEVDKEINKIDRQEILNKLSKIINKKLKTATGSAFNMRHKICSDLYNLGFSKDMIDEIMIDNFDDSKSLEKDYKKAYLSASKKEKDINKIYYIIKQKLYQKGYSLDEIELVINKKRD